MVFEEDQQVKIHHATFYDYLVSCKGKPRYIDARIHKVVIASRCFETMATSLKHDIGNLQSSPSLGKNVKDLGEPIRGDIPFYLQYVCCNWFRHLRDVPYTPELCDKLRSFVYNELLFWFEVISLMGIFSDHVGAGVTCAILWIEVCGQYLFFVYILSKVDPG